jgi:hypothetical protein
MEICKWHALRLVLVQSFRLLSSAVIMGDAAYTQAVPMSMQLASKICRQNIHVNLEG